METLSTQINYIVEQLQEPEQILVLEIVKRFLTDDIATPDDSIDISIAREEYLRGESIKDADIDWT